MKPGIAAATVLTPAVGTVVGVKLIAFERLANGGDVVNDEDSGDLISHSFAVAYSSVVLGFFGVAIPPATVSP